MLESHLEGEIRYHLHLNSCRLHDTKDEVRNLQLEVGERAQAVQNQFEERVQALQNHFEDRLHALQNRFEERVQALENRFEERVNLLTVTGDKMRKNLQNRFEERVQALEKHFEERVNLITVDSSNKLWKNLSLTGIICAVAAVVILAALSGMSNHESAVSDLKTKVDRSFERQSKLEMKVNEVEKGLKGELIDLRSQLGKEVDEANKYFEAVPLNMSNHESAVSDFKTKMDRSVDRQSKLEMKMNEVEKGLQRELIDLRSQLGKEVDEANKYFEAVLLNMTNHESAVSDFKTKMDRSVDRQSKLEMKMNEVEKGLKRELIDLQSHLGKKVDESNKYFEAVSLNMSNHESAVSDFKTKMEGRVTDVQTKVEGKLDEAHKYLKEKVS